MPPPPIIPVLKALLNIIAWRAKDAYIGAATNASRSVDPQKRQRNYYVLLIYISIVGSKNKKLAVLP